MPAECCKKTWGKVPDDEPVFIIRGQDKLAVATISTWLKWAEQQGVTTEKLKGAQKHLAAVLAFQEQSPDRVKLPD